MEGFRRFVGMGVTLALCMLALTGSACDDGDETDGAPASTPVAGEPTPAEANADAAAIEEVLRAAVSAWNAQDAEELASHFTDAGLESSFGEGEAAPREEIVAMLPEFIGEPPISVQELNVEAAGASGTAEVLWKFGRAVERVEMAVVREGDAWKIDRETQLPVDIPSGVRTVEVEMSEFAFATDVPAATDAIAFEVHNGGRQAHELVFAKIPADAVVEELFASEEDVPGFEFIGFVGPIEVGETRNLVLAERLEAGRYVMVCFLPDTDEGAEGTPHAFKGMVYDFTLGEGVPSGFLPRL